MEEKNAKGALLNLCAQRRIASPIFREHLVEGPRPFKCVVDLDGQEFESISGFGTKKEAQQNASLVALQSLKAKYEKGASRLLEGPSKSLSGSFASRSAKNDLQDYCLKKRENFKNQIPHYVTARAGGTDHDPRFKSVVKIADFEFSSDAFSTKLEAELDAATKALQNFSLENEQMDNSSLVSSSVSSPQSKNALQEYCQQKFLGLPVYSSSDSGPPHAKIFQVTVTVGDQTFESVGSHSSKKSAEQSAASEALRSLTNSSQDGKSVGINWKSKLQEYCQRNRMSIPDYRAKSKGPDHMRSWTVTVQVNSEVFTSGMFSSKANAEQDAAKIAFEKVAPGVLALAPKPPESQTKVEPSVQRKPQAMNSSRAAEIPKTYIGTEIPKTSIGTEIPKMSVDFKFSPDDLAEILLKVGEDGSTTGNQPAITLGTKQSEDIEDEKILLRPEPEE